METVALVGILAAANERFIEYAFGNTFDKIPKLCQWKWTLLYVQLITGVLLAIGLQVNAIQSLLPDVSTAPLIGQIITGFIIGCGSELVHLLFNLMGAKTSVG